MLEDWGLPAVFAEVAHLFDGKDVPEHAEYPLTFDYCGSSTRPPLIADVCVSDPTRQPHLWPSLRESPRRSRSAPPTSAACSTPSLPSGRSGGSFLKVPTNQVLPSEEIERRALEAAERIERRAASQSDAKERPLVLAVDDDPVSLRLLVAQLQRAGHKVVTASNGREAMAIALEKNRRSSSPTG